MEKTFRFLLTFTLLLAACTLTAKESKKSKKTSYPAIIVQDYKDYDLSPTLKDFAKYDKKTGVAKGQGSLLMTRPEGSLLYKVVSDTIKIAPGQVYDVTIWAQGTNLKCKNVEKYEKTGWSFVAVEYKKDGQYISGGTFPKFKLKETKGWKEVKFRFQAKPEFDEAMISFFIQRDVTGSIRIGGYSIEKVAAPAAK